eukprot:EG_transcript_24776
MTLAQPTCFSNRLSGQPSLPHAACPTPPSVPANPNDTIAQAGGVDVFPRAPFLSLSCLCIIPSRHCAGALQPFAFPSPLPGSAPILLLVPSRPLIQSFLRRPLLRLVHSLGSSLPPPPLRLKIPQL